MAILGSSAQRYFGHPATPSGEPRGVLQAVTSRWSADWTLGRVSAIPRPPPSICVSVDPILLFSPPDSFIQRYIFLLRISNHRTESTQYRDFEAKRKLGETAPVLLSLHLRLEPA